VPARPAPSTHAASNDIPQGQALQVLDAPPYAADGATFSARLLGDALRALELRSGDQLVFRRSGRAAFGDFAALRETPADPLTIWKVYPQGDGLLLSDGRRRHRAKASTLIEGVLMALKRPLQAGGP